MGINWKVRFKNPVFWMDVIVVVFATLLAGVGMAWEEVNSWPMLWNVILTGLKNPVVVIAVLAAVWSTIKDPTTKGITDSARALDYDKPAE